MQQENFRKDFFSFLQEKGFIWGPEPELYGGMAGFHTYGPLGKLLKNKIEQSVRKVFTSNGIWELEGPTVLPNIVWQASGHLDTFKDPVISCSKCKSNFRVDKLLEEHGIEGPLSDQQMLNAIEEKKIKCPNCKADFAYEIRDESLMMYTTVGGEPAALRPETATVTYLPYKRMHVFFRRKIPFGVFQIGKAYRNEISPRQSVIRGREFTQAEAQIFIDPIMKNEWPLFNIIKNKKIPLWTETHQKKKKRAADITLDNAVRKKLVKTKAYAWCLWLAYQQFVAFGIPLDKIRIRQHHQAEKAFYADDAWDIEINLNSFGWTECCGVHDRTDYDLRKHSEFSKERLDALRDDGTAFVPHILEIAFGTDRPVFAMLDLFYNKKDAADGKTMLRLPYNFSPVDIMIFPLVKDKKLVKISQAIKQDLEDDFIVVYDESSSIGKRYLRASEAGTPYCITVDFISVKKNDVTVRDRNSEKQIRVKTSKLKETLVKLMAQKIKFKDAGKLINYKVVK